MTPVSAGRKRPSLADVAKSADVSTTVVSQVLNEVPTARVAPATRRRVQEAAARLGYRPHGIAKALREGRTRTVAFITDEIATSEFAGAILAGAQRCAREAGHLVIVMNTGGEPDAEEAAVELALDQHCDGVLFAAIYLKRVQPPRVLGQVPTVLVDCYAADSAAPVFVPDDEQGGRDATAHLLAHGHRRIAFLNGSEALDASHRRLAGYRSALEGAAVAFDPSLVTFGSYRPDNGYAHGLEQLGRPDRPTALFCGNDLIAFGAYQAIGELGLSVPGDVSVVGYDNLALGGYFRPPLTTVALPHDAMGYRGMRELLDRLDPAAGEPGPPATRLEHCELVPRRSVAPPRNRPEAD